MDVPGNVTAMNSFAGPSHPMGCPVNLEKRQNTWRSSDAIFHAADKSHNNMHHHPLEQWRDTKV
jgi:hypothetical protein